MASISTQARRISGLEGAKFLSDPEQEFVATIASQTNDGNSTSSLTDQQIDSLDRIYSKHFSK
jgi:hypothetical protein